MDAENVRQVGSATYGRQDGKGYMDSDIAFLDNMRDMPLVDGSVQVDRFISVMCYTGRMQMEVNTTVHTIHAGQVLICHQNDTISNTMLSPDFEGAVLSLSHKIIMELFGESSMWDYFFHLVENPVITVRPESMEMLRLYGKTFHEKTRMGRTVFHKEIICFLIKAIFYEVRENIEERVRPDAKGLRHGEVLFKQFMELLSGCIAKPRSVSWYAGQLCITPKHLSTVCKQVSGKTAFDWINEYVLLDIRKLLKGTDKPIKEIADMLRFPNVSFFGTYCRKHSGMTPVEYRKYLRNSATENAKNQSL